MPENSPVTTTTTTTTTLTTTTLTTMTPIERRHLVASWGDHAQAGAMLQPGLRTVDVIGPGGRAFAACTRALGSTIVLGEPVGDTDGARADVVAAVLDDDPHAIFFQVRPAFAALLTTRFGLRVTPIGTEPIIDVAAFTLRGRRRQSVRTALRHARAHGVTVTELDGDDTLHTGAIAHAAYAWERTRRRRQIRFLVPPLHHRVPGLSRTFVAKHGDAVLGFVTFDALSEAGHIRGYTPSVSRASTQFRAGLWYVLMAHALQQFQREGIASVNLGLVPLSRPSLAASTTRSPASPGALLPLLRLLRVVGRPVYPFAGIEHAKGRLGGEPVMSFLGHRRALPLGALLGTWWRTFVGP